MTNKQKGFTLIETLVAVFIIIIAIGGPITLAQKGLRASLIAKDQIGAFYLAQDAIEYVRFVRDTNRLSGLPWLAGLDGSDNGHTNASNNSKSVVCISADGTAICTIDSVNDLVESCGATCGPVLYDATSNGGYYNYSTGSRSLYTRTVWLQTLPTNPAEVSVNVLVSWSDSAGIVRKVAVHENLLDWQ